MLVLHIIHIPLLLLLLLLLFLFLLLRLLILLPLLLSLLLIWGLEMLPHGVCFFLIPSGLLACVSSAAVSSFSLVL